MKNKEPQPIVFHKVPQVAQDHYVRARWAEIRLYEKLRGAPPMGHQRTARERLISAKMQGHAEHRIEIENNFPFTRALLNRLEVKAEKMLEEEQSPDRIKHHWGISHRGSSGSAGIFLASRS